MLAGTTPVRESFEGQKRRARIVKEKMTWQNES